MTIVAREEPNARAAMVLALALAAAGAAGCGFERQGLLDEDGGPSSGDLAGLGDSGRPDGGGAPTFDAAVTSTVVEAGAGDVDPDDAAAPRRPAGQEDGAPAPEDAGAADGPAPEPDVARPPDLAPVTPDAPLPDAPGPVVCPTNTNELRLCMPFEGMSSDDSKAAHRVVSREVAFVPGLAGHAARLDLQSDIRVPDGLEFDSGSFTLEAWIRLESLPASGRATILDKPGRYGLWVTPTGDLGCFARGMNVTAPRVVTPGVWVAAACTVAAGPVVTVWIEGVNRTNARAAAAPGPVIDQPLMVGGNSQGREKLIGLLDNVRIWTRALGLRELCTASTTCR